jgi:hypothetical protein
VGFGFGLGQKPEDTEGELDRHRAQVRALDLADQGRVVVMVMAGLVRVLVGVAVRMVVTLQDEVVIVGRWAIRQPHPDVREPGSGSLNFGDFNAHVRESDESGNGSYLFGIDDSRVEEGCREHVTGNAGKAV